MFLVNKLQTRAFFRQFVVCLDSSVRVKDSFGAERVIPPGGILLAEDTTGQGATVADSDHLVFRLRLRCHCHSLLLATQVIRALQSNLACATACSSYLRLKPTRDGSRQLAVAQQVENSGHGCDCDLCVACARGILDESGSFLQQLRRFLGASSSFSARLFWDMEF